MKQAFSMATVSALLAVSSFAGASAPAREPPDGAAARVILFERSRTEGHAAARKSLREALQRLAGAKGFRLQVTSDPADITEQNLATAQVLVLGNGDGDVLPAGAARQAVEAFVQEDGKGLIVIHAGAAFIREWDFLREGVAQQYHRHAPGHTRAFVYLDTSGAHGLRHPAGREILEGLPSRAALHEEFYSFEKSPRIVPGVTVLLSLDGRSAKPGLTYPMQDHPLVWMRRMGKGSVVTHTLGHNPSSYVEADSLAQRLLWNEIRYLSKGGCEAALCKQGLQVLESRAPRELEIRPRRNAILVRVSGEGAYRVAVLDISGKSVASGGVKGGAEASFSGLKAGSYLVKVEAPDAKIFKRRVVVR